MKPGFYFSRDAGGCSLDCPYMELLELVEAFLKSQSAIEETERKVALILKVKEIGHEDSR